MENEIIKNIDKIKSNYGEPIFRCSLGHLFEVGINNFNDKIVQNTINKISKEDDKNQIMTNDFKIEIIKCAFDLSKIDVWEILRYIYLRKLYIGK